jgi:hypothetical protein
LSDRLLEPVNTRKFLFSGKEDKPALRETDPKGLCPLGELANPTGIESNAVLLWYSTEKAGEI